MALYRLLMTFAQSATIIKLKSRISEAVYAATEQERFNKECKHIAKMFDDDRDGLDGWIYKVAQKRGDDAAVRLKKGVKWLWRKRDEK